MPIQQKLAPPVLLFSIFPAGKYSVHSILRQLFFQESCLNVGYIFDILYVSLFFFCSFHSLLRLTNFTYMMSFDNSTKLLEEYLQVRVDNLPPTEDEIKDGREVMNKIFDELKRNSGYSIDRTVPYGGTVKKTSIKGFLDFDCAISVNSTYSRLTVPNVLEGFQNTLVMAEHLDLQEEDFVFAPKNNPKTLTFAINNINFDVCAHIYESDSIIELNVEYATEKSSFAHEVARLAKSWNKSLILELETQDWKISGRSSIMELVGFSAAEEEEEEAEKIRRQRNHLRAFRGFLEKMRDIEKMSISYEAFWRSRRIHFDLCYASTPYVFNPSDPSKNFLERVAPNVRQILSRFAQETLDRLRRFEAGDLQVDVFENQPRWYQKKTKCPKPTGWIIGHIKAQTITLI